jgi:hypothetical protein
MYSNFCTYIFSNAAYVVLHTSLQFILICCTYVFLIFMPLLGIEPLVMKHIAENFTD